MAKRPNRNQRNKNTDDSDNRTIIKIASPKQVKENSATKKSNSTNKKKENSNTPAPKKAKVIVKKTSRTNTSRKSKPEPAKKVIKKSSEQQHSSTNINPTNTAPAKTTISTPTLHTTEGVKISQSVAILIDGNNIEMSLTKLTNNKSAVLNFDKVIPKLLHGRGLNRLIYFREGRSISKKLADRLHTHYFGSVVPCHKSADIPLSIQATQLAEKVDTIIILSGDSDYVELVRHVKSKGVRVEIAAIEITTANILKEEADYYSPITEEDAFIVK